ncbi:MAG: hypothetical protein CSB06_02230 [Bacteroidia bacterium]|nr:MAG: hypothetical protein CSB06_02230 [Bacteroidia bacterium]
MKHLNVKNTLFLLTLLLSLKASHLSAQSLTDSIHWISLEEAGKRFLKKPQPIIIYLYETDNDSCRMQSQDVFCKKEVADYINILFLPVKIDVHTKDSLLFFDGIYRRNTGAHGKIHDLVFELSGMKKDFPAFVLFNKQAVGQTFKGYKNRDQIFRFLIYYGEEMYESLKYEDWYACHLKGFPPGKAQIMSRLYVKWKDVNDLENLQKEKRKKVLLNFYNYYKTSCSLMRMRGFNSPKIAKVLNEHYYPVNIDVFTKDTLRIRGQEYVNSESTGSYHDLPVHALEANMKFPAFLIMDEDGNVLYKTRQFLLPQDLECILKYYAEDAYKEEPFEKFQEQFIPSVDKY